MIFSLVVLLVFLAIQYLPEKLYKWALKYGKRFVRKQIKHELKRYRI